MGDRERRRTSAEKKTRIFQEWNHEQCPVLAQDTLGGVGNGNGDTKIIAAANSAENWINVDVDVDVDADVDEDADVVELSPLPISMQPPTDSPTALASAGPTEDPASKHYFSPSDRNRNRRLGRTLAAAESPFLKTQGLFFGNGQSYSDHRILAQGKTPWSDANQTATAIRNNSSSNSSNTTLSHSTTGLLWAAVGVVLLVIVWLALLAIYWLRRDKGPVCRGRRRGHTARHNASFDTKTVASESLPPTPHPNKPEEGIEVPHGQAAAPTTTFDEEEESKLSSKMVLKMECESAASPRWLSFPETSAAGSALKSVASFFTSTSLASLASQDDLNSNLQQKQEDNSAISSPPGNPIEMGRSHSLWGEYFQFYKVGVVRDGRIDVSSPDADADDTNNNDNQNTHGEASDPPTNNSRDLPWKEILGKLLPDLVTCDEDLNNVSFANNSLVGEEIRISTNEEDILRDLEQLERQVTQTKKNHMELQDLQELELGMVRSPSKSKQQQQGNDLPIDASTISALLTTAMQQKNQENLLDEEGVEIWYDTQTQTFFRNDETGTHEQPSFIEEDEGRRCLGKIKPVHNNSRSRTWPCSGTIFGYKSLTSPSFDSDVVSEEAYHKSPTTTMANHKGAAGTDASQAPSQLLDRNWDKFGRVVFFVAGVGILASSISMATFGANALSDAASKAQDVLGDAQKLTLEGTRLFDGFLESSSELLLEPTTISTSIINTEGDGRMYSVFESVMKRLFQTTNASCDINNSTYLLLKEALETIVGLWNEHVLAPSNGYNNEIDGDDATGSGMILSQLEGLQNDLSNVSEVLDSLEESWVVPYNAIVLVLRVGNALLATFCLWLLVGTARQQLHHADYKCFVLPLYVTLVVLSLVACLFFLVGWTGLQDFCGGDPDAQAFDFLSASAKYQQNSEDWSDLPYDMAKEYIRQCPSGERTGIPTEAAIPMDLGWELSRGLWEVSKLLLDTETCVSPIDVYGGNTTSIPEVTEVGELVMQTSCEFSVVLHGLLDVFGCDNWHRLYEEGMHNAVCDAGRSGFLWVASTQFIIVGLSLVMLTVRIVLGYPCKSDSEYRYSQDKDKATNVQRDTTMLIEEEDDYDEAENGDDDPFPSINREVFFQTATAFDNDSPFVESPKQIAMPNPHLRSSRNGNLKGQKKRGNKYVSSTDLYFEAAHEYEYSSDDDDDDPNVEVCLHPSKLFGGVDVEPWGGYSTMGNGQEPPLQTSKGSKSESNKSKPNYSNAVWNTSAASEWSSSTSSSKDFNGEVDRVRERLKRRQNKKKRQQQQQQQQGQFAPTVNVTVTTQ